MPRHIIPSLLLLTLCTLEAGQTGDLEERISVLEHESSPQSLTSNPSPKSHIRDRPSYFFSGDALLWQARENGLPVGVTNTLWNGGALNPGGVQDLNFRWNWGFRIGLGLNLPKDQWDLYINWTRITSLARLQTLTSAVNQEFYPVWINPASANAGFTVGTWNANWKNRLNLIDLQLGRAFETSGHLWLRPYAGIRTSWIRQDYGINYLSMNGSASNSSIVSQTNHYWGLGIVAGVDTNWRLGAGFSLYGNVALSALAGFFSLTFLETDTTSSTRTTFVSMNHHLRLGTPITDLQLGLRWDTSLCTDRYFLMIQLGWEQHMFFGQNQMIRFNDSNAIASYSSNLGDLSYQGWTLAARFDF